VGSQAGQREFVLLLPDGESVLADERFFLVEAKDETISRNGWSAHEAEVMVDHRWWSEQELAQTSEIVWPEDLLAMLAGASSR